MVMEWKRSGGHGFILRSVFTGRLIESYMEEVMESHVHKNCDRNVYGLQRFTTWLRGKLRDKL
jgi:hypothetical protein